MPPELDFISGSTDWRPRANLDGFARLRRSSTLFLETSAPIIFFQAVEGLDESDALQRPSCIVSRFGPPPPPVNLVHRRCPRNATPTILAMNNTTALHDEELISEHESIPCTSNDGGRADDRQHNRGPTAGNHQLIT